MTEQRKLTLEEAAAYLDEKWGFVTNTTTAMQYAADILGYQFADPEPEPPDSEAVRKTAQFLAGAHFAGYSGWEKTATAEIAITPLDRYSHDVRDATLRHAREIAKWFGEEYKAEIERLRAELEDEKEILAKLDGQDRRVRAILNAQASEDTDVAAGNLWEKCEKALAGLRWLKNEVPHCLEDALEYAGLTIADLEGKK